MKHRVRSYSLRFAPLAMTVAVAASVYVGGTLFAAPAAADEYSVQIGAFENPDPSFAAAAEQVGKLYRTRNRDGLTRIQVGRYASMEEANVALRALAGVGYTDAYVVNKSARPGSMRAGSNGARATVSNTSNTSGTVSNRGPRGDDSSLLASVPAELRARTVLLDGRLHVMEGTRFIPLREYLAGNR